MDVFIPKVRMTPLETYVQEFLYFQGKIILFRQVRITNYFHYEQVLNIEEIYEAHKRKKGLLAPYFIGSETLITSFLISYQNFHFTVM